MSVETPQLAADESHTIDVAANLQAVRDRVDLAARQSAQGSEGVSLIAVSKTHDASRIRPALDAGHRVFGENRIQEAAAKWPELREVYDTLELHLIGPLQTNKVKTAIAHFDVIQTVDRPKLARVLAEEMTRSDRRRECFVEVNVGEEPQKSGILPREADAFIKECRDQFQLPIRGVMCIPPIGREPSPYFALLAMIGERNGLSAVSMGMSGDYEVAIAFGATHVRVGTAIFGPRQR
ncbi:MAG: YggS family pyridoxal phosphate-dependent enzyme [Alphaproteobacteria bacterium]|nr:YggS family pyridoxal phosphate-dependent enzyme [Alphaproteobacteria bacterium]|tara:strand:- start:99 stop:809 length:711 start_codon:yes stop_codon:yes gene_type:complete